ncbi:MAG: hypothetical protein II942_04675 [Alphaproteobacteria bacterium]|nr:hypothetical protein [Alphaproteobacteria bacterium]
MKKIKDFIGKVGFGVFVGLASAFMSVDSGWEALVGLGTIGTAIAVGSVAGIGALGIAEAAAYLAPQAMNLFRRIRNKFLHRDNLQETLQAAQIHEHAPVPQASVTQTKAVQKTKANELAVQQAKEKVNE